MSKSRLAAGAGALIVGAAGIFAAYLAPDPAPGAAEPILVEGTARQVSLGCPPDFEKTMGEMTAGIGGEDSPTLLRTRTIVLGGGEAALQGSDLGRGELRTAFEEGAFPGELTVAPGESPVLAAATTQRYQEFGELAGLAMTPCTSPASSLYLVGGSTSASSSAQLVLTNVTGSPAVVDVTVHTSVGTASPSIVSTTAVDAHSSQTLLLETGVRDPRLALEITSTGGQISAHLLAHEVDGIVGTGVESVTAGAEPDTSVVIPGADLSGEHGSTVLRAANPSDESAVISISAVTAEGTEPVPGGQDITIAAGTVLDLSMDGLAGEWSALIVEADRPVLAAARVDVDGDYAWLPSAVPLERGAVSAPATDSELTLYSPVPASAEVTFYSHTGTKLDSQTTVIDPIGTVESPDDTSFIVVDADTAVYGGLLATRTIGSITGVAGLPLTGPPAASSDLLVDVIN